MCNNSDLWQGRKYFKFCGRHICITHPCISASSGQDEVEGIIFLEREIGSKHTIGRQKYVHQTTLDAMYNIAAYLNERRSGAMEDIKRKFLQKDDDMDDLTRGDRQSPNPESGFS